VDATTKSLEELVRDLPPEMLAEVRDFVESLLKKRAQAQDQELQLDWRGALRDQREQYTAVELEHKASEWWE